MRKRLIALSLSILMVLLLLPVTVAEEDTEPIETIEALPASRSAVVVDSNDFDAGFLAVLINIGAAAENGGVYTIDDAFEEINCSNNNLTSIRGVEKFTNLKRLNCEENRLSDINLAGLQLEELNLNDNQLTVNALNNAGWDRTTIKKLEVARNGLDDISFLNGFTAIEEVNCSGNALTAIDVSGFTTLRKLDCQFNGQLASLKINSGLTDLEMGGTSLTPNTVDFNGATLTVVKLDGIWFDLTLLEQFPLTTLDIDNYPWTTLDFTPWANLHDLRCDGSSLTSLTVAGLSDLYTLRANDNDLTSIDLTGLTSLKELYLNGNQLTELTLPANVTLNDAELNQTITGQTYTDNGDGTYSFDLGTLVTNLTQIWQMGGAVWVDQGNSSLVSFNSEPQSFTYDYYTGDPNHTMLVTVEFGNGGGNGGNGGGNGGQGTPVQVDPSDFDAELWCALQDKGYIIEDNGNYTIDADTEEIDLSGGGYCFFALTGIKKFPNLKKLNISNSRFDDNTLDASQIGDTLEELTGEFMELEKVLNLDQLPNLKILSLYWNCIDTCDVSSNLLLTHLDLTENRMPALDVSNNTELETLWVSNNSYEETAIGTLNLSNNTKLINLGCSSCGLDALDLTNNPDLEEICCSWNDISTLTVSHLTNLRAIDFAFTRIDEIDLSSNINLTSVICDGMENLRVLDLSAQPLVDTLRCNDSRLNELILHASAPLNDECNFDATRSIGGQKVEQDANGYYFDLTQLVQLANMAHVTVTSADAAQPDANGKVYFTTQNAPEQLTYTYASGNVNVAVDFTVSLGVDIEVNATNFPDDNFRAYLLQELATQGADGKDYVVSSIMEMDCGYRSIASLEGIERFTMLEKLNCQDNELSSIDVSAMPSLKVLDCHSNPLDGTIKFHKNLEELECWNSQIDETRIIIPNNSALRVVKVDASQVDDLSFLNGLALETIDCPYNGFTALDFTPWPNLHDLRCDGSSLKSLTVVGLSDLELLRANDNELTSIDLSGVTALKELYVNGNRLAELVLPNGVTLENAELDQTIPDAVLTDNGDGSYSFDLGTLVSDLNRVTLQGDANWADPNNRGVVTWQSMPTDFRYTYDIGDPNFTMPVHVFFDVKISVSQADFAPDFWDWLRNNGIIACDNGAYSISGSVTEINCSYAGLASLKGIEFFTNLEALYCEGNELTSLDLSRLDALKKLYANDNHLAELLLSQSAPLEEGDIDRQNRSVYDVIPVAADQYTFDLSKMVTHPDRVTELTAADAEENPISVSLIDGVLHFGGLPSTFGYGYETGIMQDDGTPVLYEVVFTDVGVGPAFKSKTMTLEGMIGVNFYMDLSNFSDEDKEDSYMEFTINGRTQRDDYDPDCLNPNGDGYYGFTCYITSIEMADLITATFCYRNGRTQETQFTAQEYLKAAKTQYTGVTKEAVESVADYGHYVQEYLTEVNQTDDGHETIEAATTITQQNITAAKNATVDYAIQRKPVQDSYIISTPFSLSVNDTITINLYVETEDNREITALLTRPGESEPEEMTVERVNGKYRVRIAGIKASELADSFIITLNAGGADMPVTVSALSYVQAVLSNPEHGEDSAARKAVTAIYQYYVKTKAYVDAQNQQNP